MKGGNTAMSIMPIERIPDWEKRLARHDAFWAREIIDRPFVSMIVPNPNPDFPLPATRGWASHRERWMDAEYQAELALARVMNRDYLGDALPGVFPNLGPEIFSAFFGTELEYGETTSWSVPNLADWAEADKLQLSRDNPYWRKVIELTDALLDIGRNRFYTGITDLHPGGDAIAAFRDPAVLSVDLMDHRDAVRALLDRVTEVYLRVFDFHCDKLRAADQAICTWMGIVSSRKWYVPSNDFSCMISKAMFDEVFLPGIIQECRHLDASIYHLDGPDALHHLESLLEIEELNAIQWVYGAGAGRASDWLSMYERCQQAGKGIQVRLDPDEMDLFMERLRPEGVWLSVNVRTREEGDAVLARLSRWR